MNDYAKQELDKIVSKLADTGVVSQVYLFGSYARGEETPDSDLDLYVLTTVKDKRPHQQAVEFRRTLRGVKTMSLDLFARYKDDFYDAAKRTTSFPYDIVKNGVLLYDNG